jgi:hypothetical protein
MRLFLSLRKQSELERVDIEALEKIKKGELPDA